MDYLVKGIIFGGLARVAVLKTTECVNQEIILHELSPLAAAALGRTLTMGAYLSDNLKGADSTFSITVNGGGQLGNVVVAGDSERNLRGFVENPAVELPLRQDGHLDVGAGVGRNGQLTVIKDLGLKEPYVGRCQLVTGEIAEDFAQYLFSSEGIKNAVALGVLVDKNGCLGAGGVVVEALPGMREEQLFMLEDIMDNFKSVSALLAEKSPEEIFEFYFSHLDSEVYPREEISIRCSCSTERIEGLVKGLGEQEAREIIADIGRIEVKCHFCEKNYCYTDEDVDRLWEK